MGEMMTFYKVIIFEALEQADGSATRDYGGSGLCPAIVRQVVELLEGKIRVENRPGGGGLLLSSLP